MAVAGKTKKVFDNRYEILSIVGRGAASVVYHARHLTAPGNEVALKVLVEQSRNRNPSGNSERLRKEALAMLSCRHPYVLRVDDFYSVGSICYLCLEFAPESDLRKYTSLLGGRLGISQMTLFLSQALEALGWVHQQGIIHRDIKPDNILVINHREVRLCDFGVALLPGEESSLEDLQAGVGTMNYMAPEVLEGKIYDHRADIYALGVTFYELLTNQHPFESAPLMRQLEVRQDHNIPTLQSFVPDLPLEIDQLVRRMMSYDADDRPNSAEEILKQLNNNEKQDNISSNIKPSNIKKNQANIKKNQANIKENQTISHYQADYQPTVTVSETIEAPSPFPLNIEDEISKEEEEQAPLEDLAAVSAEASIDLASAHESPYIAGNLTNYTAESNASENNATETFVSSSSIIKPSVTDELNVPRSAGAMTPPAGAVTPTLSADQTNQVVAYSNVVSLQPEEHSPPLNYDESGAVKTAISAAEEPTPNNPPNGAEHNNSEANIFSEEDISSQRIRDIRRRKKHLSSQETAEADDLSLQNEEANALRPQNYTPRSARLRKLALPVMAITAVSFILVLKLLSRTTTPEEKGLALQKNDNQVVSQATDEKTSLLPNYQGGAATFPDLPSGVYRGTISRLIASEDLPLTFISYAERGKLAVFIGVEGWTPKTIDLDENNNQVKGSRLRVAANGFLIEFSSSNNRTSAIAEKEVAGTFKNLITGETGVWKISPSPTSQASAL
jgi:serine/threonine protein kinase